MGSQKNKVNEQRLYSSLSIKNDLLFNFEVFSLGKFFQKVKNGQKKCPKIEKVDSGLQKHALTA